MDITMHASFRITALSGASPGMGLLDHMAALLLVFEEPLLPFSIMLTPIYIPPQMVGF